MAPHPDAGPEPGDVLTALLADAQRDLDLAAGSASLCALSREGRPVPAAKYHEGRWAALREVARGRRAHVPGSPTPTEHDATVEVLAAWTTALDAVTARSAGADWIAYRTGGVDALTALITAGGTTVPGDGGGTIDPDRSGT